MTDSNLVNRILSTSALKKRATIFSESDLSQNKSIVSTPIPILNIALSGDVKGGLSAGLITIAGPSKHFKSLLGLVMVAAFLKKKPNSVCLFYDSEFGSSKEYFSSVGIDTSRVVHIPVMNVEELKFDLIQQLEGLDEKDEVIIFIDSVGNLASKKEVEDAKDNKSVADMTRAKGMKSLWRMVTPYLNMKNIPLVAISHTYNTMEMFSKAVVSGGTGAMYSSNTVFIIGRQQEKDGKELAGYNFIINVEKSRAVKEKSKLPLNVVFGKGINPWSGLLDIAVETGHVVKPSNGFYTRPHIPDDKKVRQKATNTKEFWLPVFSDTDFLTAIRNKYQLQTTSIMEDTDSDNND